MSLWTLYNYNYVTVISTPDTMRHPVVTLLSADGGDIQDDDSINKTGEEEEEDEIDEECS